MDREVAPSTHSNAYRSISMNIYTLPYFYIIQHIRSKKLYAGSRWAKGCHPDELLKPNGYITSSKSIRNIILKEGIDSFEIIRIDTCCDSLHPYDYESIFLEAHNCANSGNWFNYHNNNRPPPFGSDRFAHLMQNRYGVDNYFKSQEFKDNASEIYINAFGFDHPMHCADIRNRLFSTKMMRYGHRAYNNHKQSVQTLLNTKGVINAGQLEHNRERQREVSRYLATCPHCGKSGQKIVMGRWHFDNCKSKPPLSA